MVLEKSCRMSLLWGLASYISARKGGLVGSIHYPSDRMPTATHSYLEWLASHTAKIQDGTAASLWVFLQAAVSPSVLCDAWSKSPD